MWQQTLAMLPSYLPNLVAALAILVFGWLGAIIVAALVRGRCGAPPSTIGWPIGWWGRPERRSRSSASPAGSPTGWRVGTLLVVTVMLFASIEAAGLMGFDNLAELLSGFALFAGDVILGLIVFGVGLYLARLVSGEAPPQQSGF